MPLHDCIYNCINLVYSWLVISSDYKHQLKEPLQSAVNDTFVRINKDDSRYR